MNRPWSFYRLDTGEFTGRQFVGPDRAVELNTPEECGAVPGRYEKGTQRLDLGSGLVVRRERAQVEIDTEQRRQRSSAAMAHIQELEQKQARRVRELLAESDPTLKEIDLEITALRKEL